MRTGTFGNFSFPTQGEKRRGKYRKGKHENKGKATAASYKKYY